MTRIDLVDGKYTLTHDNGADLRALRYGERWLNLSGNGLVLAMAQEIEHLREQSAIQKTTIEALETLRPHWAQGYTTDSVAAQVTTGATLQLWDMLGVTNQTDAVSELQALQNERDRHVPDRDGMAFTTINGVDIAVGEDLTDGVYTLNVMAQGQDGPIVLVHIHQHRCATRETP